MPDPIDIASRVAKKADRAAADFQRRLGRVWREAERRARVLIQNASESPTSRIRGTQAAALRQQMRQALTEAGFDALVDEATDEPFDRLATQLLQDGTEIARLVARPQIQALKELHRLDLLDEGDAVAKELWSAMARGLYVRKPADDILRDLGEVLDATDAHIATWYDTSLSIFTRQVELLEAGDDPETRFLYTGPDDDVTRPFCKAHVGQVYTRAEIERMDNGQLDNVLLTGGGWNCRHLFLQVSRFSEIRAA